MVKFPPAAGNSLAQKCKGQIFPGDSIHAPGQSHKPFPAGPGIMISSAAETQRLSIDRILSGMRIEDRKI
ncbi:MAG: hypothetical protein DMG06_03075 [Acidobacteria bacterium]|nr:MAG: hypothetical protein DMG06_03075 [Acidobacteriota bacterium]